MKVSSLLALLCVLAGCEADRPKTTAAPHATAMKFHARPGGDGKLHVYFFDVGQGDSALVISPTGHSVLIDGGPIESAELVIQRLSQLLSGPLDLAVLTHPQENHLGGFEEILPRVGVKRFMDPEIPATTTVAQYHDLRAWMAANKVEVFAPTPDAANPDAPVEIGIGGGAQLAVYWPRRPLEPFLDAPERGTDPNSMVTRVAWGNTSVLFMSDAPMVTEQLLLGKSFRLESTVLKVGAHGGESSGLPSFLRLVSPLAAVISVGAGNTVRAPSRLTQQRLANVGARVFRTDLDGEIHLVADADSANLSSERLAAGDYNGRMHLLNRPAPRVTEVAKSALKLVRSDPKPVRSAAATSRAATASSGSVRKASTAPQRRYVASEKGEVFHAPECKWAKRINPANLIEFASRAEAEKKRRPHAVCAE